MEENSDIKQKAISAGVKLWQIAERLDIADTTFSKKLRRELSLADRARILTIIADLQLERRRS